MTTMQAMALDAPRTPLVMRERSLPAPGAGEILVAVAACGVCRTDLHVVDGELEHPKLPIVPGHEIVGRVAALGAGVAGFQLASASACRGSARPAASAPIAAAARRTCATRRCSPATPATAAMRRTRSPMPRYCFPLGEAGDDADIAPWLCAGLIGWRSYRMAGEGKTLGLYGFGAAAHILAQVAIWQGRRVFAFTRKGDTAAQDFARSLGAVWAGGSEEMPPEPLDAAIIFAPVGALVPPRSKRCVKAAESSAAAFTCPTSRAFPMRCCGRSGT